MTVSRRRPALIAWCLLACGVVVACVIGLTRLADAQRQRSAAVPEIAQHLGRVLPPGLKLVDAYGRVIDWPAFARDGRPLLLLPAYYRCNSLCGIAAHGALEALADTGLPPDQWRLLLVSIDPDDRPADALVLQRVYADYARWARPQVFGTTAPDIRLLTGPSEDTRALADTIGFGWQALPAASAGEPPSFAHATGLVVLAADGTVSRYLMGVRYDPAVLRAAIVDASAGRVGTLAERLLLACAHAVAVPGRLDGMVMALVRVAGLLVLATLALWVWRHRGESRGPR